MNTKTMMVLTVLAAALLSTAPSAFAATQILRTGFSQPYGLTFDAAGNLFVADTENDSVERATVADGYATIATLGGGFSKPKGIALDASGNVYVADSGNNAIVKLAQNCTSSACVTPLGGGFNGPSGLALDAAGAVYVADTGNGAVKKIPPGCVSAACVQTVASAFAVPTGVAVDAHGNVFFVDQIANDATHSGIFEIRASDNALLGIADDVYPFTGPTGIALDKAGNAYVTDKDGALVLVFAVNGSIPATSATVFATPEDFSSAVPGPRGVALDANENIYVADTAYNVIKRLLAVPLAQRSALRSLYLAAAGGGWAHNDNWCNGACPASGAPDFNAYETECTWHGVGCNASGTQVTSLDFSYNRLAGSLPSLAAMPQLTYLDFTDNALTGSIPLLTELPQLQAASFAFNRFSGSAPNLSGLSQLTFLLLDNNLLSGPLPDFTGLTQLNSFDATHNAFTGTLPDFSALPALQYFSVAQNQLSGGIPSIASLSASLQVMYLDNNEFTGTLPALAGLSNLVGFSANNNRLSGAIPDLTGLVNLQFFDVDTNQLTGSVPSLAGLSALVTASFSGNRLSGDFPDLTGATALNYLDVSSNQLSGFLPPDMSGATALNYLHVQYNQFSGDLPLPPPNLKPHQAYLCPNPLNLYSTPNDAAWNAATGQTPWWGPVGGGCDAVSRGDFEQLSNGSFEHGITGWQIGGGTCLWETASEGVLTAGLGAFPAPTPVDGDYTLVSDSDDFAVCSLYQDATVPSDAGHGSLSAAVGYSIAFGNNDATGCGLALSVTTPAGAPVASYVSLSGKLHIPLTQYAPVTFATQPGEKLRVQIAIDNRCQAFPVGIQLDNVQLEFAP